MRRTDPADGERAAIRGYGAQYRVAAELVYSALLNDNLEWIRVADPEAGRLDDFQIATPGKLDAYQIKWSALTKAFTFNKVISGEKKDGKKGPNLFRQLSDGWLSLTSIHPDRIVRVHLTSNSIASYSDKLPVSSPESIQIHFQTFLRDCWQDRKSWIESGDFSQIPPECAPTVMKLHQTSGLDEQGFFRFAEVCEFDLQFQLTEETENRDTARRFRDVKKIANILFDIVGEEKRLIEISRKDLMRRLGWERRFEFRFRHEFPVNETQYQPIQATIDELEGALTRHNRGYIALIGTPGSGKSTTLTKTLRYRPGVRVVRYYAYVRDDYSRGRGESLNFLHDLVFSLFKYGVTGKGYNFDDSRETLLDKFSSQLGELHELWTRKRVRTLILIDGLDHIDREQNPERSLIKDLPSPDQIPEGVILILGTQTIELKGLKTRIKAQLEEDRRRLVMQPLDRSAVHAVIDKVGLNISVSRREQVAKLSEGHPLALEYLINRLANAESTDDTDHILQSAIPYSGNIETSYKVYWEGLKEDKKVRDLLGLLCRLRGAIDLNQVVTWVGESAVERFILKAHHYFNKETATRWFFFHNSFRQFLLDFTGRNIFGEIDQARDREFHRRLAGFSSNADPDSPWAWEDLYHFACAGDIQNVLELFTQKRFRQQYFTFRHLSDIEDDVTICLRAAREANDPLSVVRAFIIEKELQDREFILRDLNFPGLLFRLYGEDSAVDYVIRGRELLINQMDALKFCRELVNHKRRNTARRIFDAAEPIDLLGWIDKNGHNITVYSDYIKNLEAWASVAYHFRPLTDIVNSIYYFEVTMDSGLGWSKNHHTIDSIRTNLLISLLEAIYYEGTENSLVQFCNCNKGRTYESIITSRLQFLYAMDASRGSVPLQKGREALQRILQESQLKKMQESERILIAELLLSLFDDRANAEKWLEGINQPKTWDFSRMSSDDKTLNPLMDRIRFNRLLSAIDRPADPVEAVPESGSQREGGTVLFERMIVLISNIWGRAWRKEKLESSEIVREITPAILLFHRPRKQTTNWLSWHSIQSKAPAYFTFLLQAVNAHGPMALNAASEFFDTLFQKQDTNIYWPPEWRVRIALELYREGGARENLVRRLEQLDLNVTILDGVYDRIREFNAQIWAWIEAGKPERALAILPEIIKTSFSIYSDKDTQFGQWIEWLNMVNLSEPENALGRLMTFWATQVLLHKADRGGHWQGAIIKLMEITAARYPGWAIELKAWLFDQKGIGFINGIEGLIRGVLRADAPPLDLVVIAVAHLVVPFQKTVGMDLGENLAKKCVQSIGTAKSRILLQPLFDVIETKAYRSNRVNWWFGLNEGFRKAGGDTTWLKERLPQADEPEPDGMV